MGSINAMTPYQESFGLSGAGSSTGLIFIIYNLGQIAAFPFCGLLADGYGRRVCIFVGCFIVLVGTAIQASAHERPQFMGGRFVLGLGASLASAAGPAYTVELAHPAYRGTMAGMYNNFWWLGNILAGWTTYGTNKCVSNLELPNIPNLIVMQKSHHFLGMENSHNCAGRYASNRHVSNQILSHSIPKMTNFKTMYFEP
jgi:MFS family permease